MHYYYVILLVGFAGSVIANIQDERFNGKCPFNVVQNMEGFVQEKFNGIWYEIQRYHKSDNMDCIEETYKWEKFDAYAGVYKIQHKEQNLAKRVFIDEPRELSQTYRHPGQYFIPGLGWPVWVIGTDYNTYALLWTCWDEFTPEKSYNIQRVTILARNRNFQIDSEPQLKAILDNVPFERSKLKLVTQDERCKGNDRGADGNDNSGISLIPTIFSSILMIIVCKLL